MRLRNLKINFFFIVKNYKILFYGKKKKKQQKNYQKVCNKKNNSQIKESCEVSFCFNIIFIVILLSLFGYGALKKGYIL